MRKLIFTLAVLLAIACLSFVPSKHSSVTTSITPIVYAESSQCPVVRQVCKSMWDHMYEICRLDGVIQEQCELIRVQSYNICVWQTSAEIGVTCALREEFIID